jgi:hypothetical protein
MRCMTAARALLVIAAFAGAGAAALWWRSKSQAPVSEAASEPDRAAKNETSGDPTRAALAVPASAPKDTAPKSGAGAPAPGAIPTQGLARAAGVADTTDLEPAGVAWPAHSLRPTPGTGGSAISLNVEPVVPTRLAFRALWYLGTDPEAETTWRRAINDPNTPPGVRSDLIVDMVDEGYTDNSHPTKADLPVIEARLGILERHAPYAMDEVNARAFAEAYRTLLELYIRLGGRPRGR